MNLTIYLILINLIIFSLQLIFYPLIDNYFALTPIEAISGSYWQFFTYMFLHATYDQFGRLYPFHIGMNMFVLLIFGPSVEESLGRNRFLILYFISGTGSAIFHILLTGISNIPMLGASGAVFGILTAYGILFPRNWIIIYPGIPLPAIMAVAVFAVVSFFFGIFDIEKGVANFGHLGGIITGCIFTLYWKKVKKIQPFWGNSYIF